MRLSYLFWTAALTFALVPLAAIARGQPDPKPKPAARVALPDPKAPPPVQLPLTRVVLYNAGVAYFHREGDVTDNARLDLKFDEGDINDLLKSLVLTDKDGGKVRAVTYDNRVPVEFTLKGFAIDVTENPTMGQLLHQLRGEKVEVTDRAGVSTTGRIVSVERPPVLPMATADPGELLNMLTEDGLQTVELKQLKKTKLMRPELQAEFVKALETLASAKGDNKKAVSVVFSGNGKRKVAVGYVTEAPLWKPSYRLTVDTQGATRMQGWASIENTTDEDWVNVKVGLVAGRPMTFQMDMYDPLYVPRPTVEPDLFASLRPPMYQGGLNPIALPGGMMGVAMGGMMGGQNAGFGGVNQNQGAGGGFTSFGGGGQGNLGFQGGFGGQFGQLGGQFGQLGGQFGFQGGLYGNVPAYLPRVPRPPLRDLYGERLSFAEYISRSRGNPPAPRDGDGERERPKPVRDPLDRNGGALAAADSKLGDMFEYTIEEPISLARQKSAMLPLLNEPVEGARVSIYNASTLAKHPLMGLKLTNKTKLHLAQGPVAVYDGGTFAGDARLPDLKPGETRLVSYAIDLGTEVVEGAGPQQATLLGVACDANTVVTRTTVRHTTTYTLRNRNTGDRTVIVEHPWNKEYKLVAPEKPADRTRDHYRFEVPVKAGELVAFNVVEETTASTSTAVAGGLNRFPAGLEVRTAVQPTALVGASIANGQVKVRSAQRRSTTYTVKNTGTAERTIPVEHVFTKGWALVSPAKPNALTPTAARFELTTKPGASATLEVVEEATSANEVLLSALTRDDLTKYGALAGTSAEARAVFARAQTLREQIETTRKALAQEQAELKEIADDQDRIRKNIEKTPKESEAYKRYLKKFDDQETVIERHQAKIKELTLEADKQERALRAFADTAKAE